MNNFKNWLRRTNPFLIGLIVYLFIRTITASGFSLAGWLYTKVMMLPGILIAIGVHEFGHAFVSYKLGDPIPKNQGRVTLNPFAHIDPWGFVSLIICGYGWGKPVEINPGYYKKKRGGEILVALAGVFLNFVAAFLFLIVYRVLFKAGILGSNLGGMIGEIALYGALINLSLLAFNIFPLPPLDGFNAVTQIFNLQKYNWWYKIQNAGYWPLLIAVFFGITGTFVSAVSTSLLRVLYNIVGII